MNAPDTIGRAISAESLGVPAEVTGRRAEAVRRLLHFERLAMVRRELGLDAEDERVVAQRVRAAYPWIAGIVLGDPAEDGDEDTCPGVSPHPAVPVRGRVGLAWCADGPGEGRVVEHTCACSMTFYELLSYGGLYRIRRTTLPRPGVPGVSYTGAWRGSRAYEWWGRLLVGRAR